VSLLREGDVFEIKSGHTVYMELPAHFAYTNRQGCFTELARTEVTVGTDKNGMDTNWIAGRYVVTATSCEGGGTGMGEHDVYPDGHYVRAEKLQKSEFDHRAKISFFQTGAFTAMIQDIAPVGRAQAKWSELLT
jgi:hypothetical protein